MVVLRRARYLTIAVNTAVAAAWAVAPIGSAPSIVLLQTIAPLYVWAIGFAVVALLLTLGRALSAHLVAVPLWGAWALSAVVGVLGGSTRSPAVTLSLTVLVLAMSSMHVHGLLWRRATAGRGGT